MIAVENVPVAARLPRPIADELKALAAARGVTASDVIRQAVEKVLSPPRARRGDPSTSRRAARSVTGLSESRAAVLDLLTLSGPLTDAQIATEYRIERSRGTAYPLQSSSGLRTRRAELCDLGLVEKVREQKLASGRAAAVWGVRS